MAPESCSIRRGARFPGRPRRKWPFRPLNSHYFSLFLRYFSRLHRTNFSQIPQALFTELIGLALLFSLDRAEALTGGLRSNTSPIFGQLSDKPLLASISLCGVSDVKNNGGLRNYALI
jgi:hypothetical protein